MRLVLLALLLAVTSTTMTARAGDFAALETFGFSADGNVFAFGQSGVRDGSGFPYADIVFVDLDADAFVKPSPVRISLEEDAADASNARLEARKQAKPLFEAHDPEANPGLVVADSPPTELSADPHRIVFLPRALKPSPDQPVELRLDILALPEGANCAGVSGDGSSAGFRLVRVATTDGAQVAVIHEDESVPESRNCPLDYRLARIVVPEGLENPARAVAIIGIESNGFEGPDMRYIAVPIPLD